MRTRLAAGSVAAAALLTLFGGDVAGADDTHNRPQAKAADPVPAGDRSPTMHESTPTQDISRRPEAREQRPEYREQRPEWLNDSPVRLTACALGTAVSRLAGIDDSCVHERLGIPYEKSHGRNYGGSH
ncbi:hypothetical protein ACWD6P_22820 [Streptomyces sp. NPDC002446]